MSRAERAVSTSAQAPDVNEVARHLEASRLFCVLPPAETRALAASAARRTFDPGKRLFLEGERNVAIHVIVRGVVCLSRSSRRGHTLTLRRVSVGSVLGQMSALHGYAPSDRCRP